MALMCVFLSAFFVTIPAGKCIRCYIRIAPDDSYAETKIDDNEETVNDVDKDEEEKNEKKVNNILSETVNRNPMMHQLFIRTYNLIKKTNPDHPALQLINRILLY